LKAAPWHTTRPAQGNSLAKAAAGVRCTAALMRAVVDPLQPLWVFSAFSAQDVDYRNGDDFSSFLGDPVVALEAVQFDPQGLIAGAAGHLPSVELAESYRDGSLNWQDNVQAARRACMTAELIHNGETNASLLGGPIGKSLWHRDSAEFN